MMYTEHPGTHHARPSSEKICNPTKAHRSPSATHLLQHHRTLAMLTCAGTCQAWQPCGCRAHRPAACQLISCHWCKRSSSVRLLQALRCVLPGCQTAAPTPPRCLCVPAAACVHFVLSESAQQRCAAVCGLLNMKLVCPRWVARFTTQGARL